MLRQLIAQDTALIAGIAAYRRHKWHRMEKARPVPWHEGGSAWSTYGLSGTASGPTILVVPSLVNRAHVLDLLPGTSFLDFLAERGFRPLLLDWGWPGEVERSFSLTDYVAGRLERALIEAARLGGGPVILAGYCMGGLLALAAAQRRPDLVRGFAALATPWDFHAGGASQREMITTLLGILDPVLRFTETLPVDVIQGLFAGLDPWGVGTKYRAFSRIAQDSDRARRFVALEDWLNDGIPLAAPVARTCLLGWYGENTPVRLRWRIAGQVVDPRSVSVPAFVAVPGRDRIVPPDSARPLAALLPHATLHEPQAGHIGMVAGSGAASALFRPFAAWLRAL